MAKTSTTITALQRPESTGAALPWRDLLVLLLIALAAQAAVFGRANGKTIINADSVQYMYNAEALISGGTPDFSLRKPGYSLWLAAVALVTGSMTWGAIAANFLVLSLLPPAAFGIAYEIRGRRAAWACGLLCLAGLQDFLYADRILSESLYTVLLSLGLWATVAAIRRESAIKCWVVAGVFLAAAWSVRSAAVVVLAGALLGVAVTVLAPTRSGVEKTKSRLHQFVRHTIGRGLPACIALVLPALLMLVAEMTVNGATRNQFRPSTGSLGMMLLMRTMHLQGLPLPATNEAERCSHWIPERTSAEAFRANEVDTWMARYRAVNGAQGDASMNDWQVDGLMRRVAWQAASAAPLRFATCSADVFVAHLLRAPMVPLDRYVPDNDRRPVIRLKPDQRADAVIPDDMRCDWEHWWAYASMPQIDPVEQANLAVRIERSSRERAPFAGDGPLSMLRYAGMHPTTKAVVGSINLWRSIPPLLLLLLLIPFPSYRRVAMILGTIYLLDAMLIAVCCPSETAAIRYRAVWLGLDSAVVGVFAWNLAVQALRLRPRWRQVNPLRNSSIPI